MAARKKTSRKKATKQKKSVVKKKKVKAAKKKTSASVSKSTIAVTAPRKKKTGPQHKNIGKKARVRTGRLAGERGVIVRQDEYLGTFFLYLDNCQNDPVYNNIEWGPYFESQLEVLKK